MDEKWGHSVFSEIVPEAQRELASALGLADPSRIVFAPNTHELVFRVLSTLPWPSPSRPWRILTSDSEFHSAARQLARLEEDGLATVRRVPVDSAGSPWSTFAARFLAEARAGAENGRPWDAVLVSEVFYNSGLWFREAARELDALPESTASRVILDGYHAFMAVPAAMPTRPQRLFYVAGGYKYAQAGEGACFLAVPEQGLSLRPVHTGWFAAYSALEKPQSAPSADRKVPYDSGAWRFAGATFDPGPWYRWVAIARALRSAGLTPETKHAHVRSLQAEFLRRTESNRWTFDFEADPVVTTQNFIGPRDLSASGHFLTFRHSRALELCRRLQSLGVITDARGDRLRFGFGPYHSVADLAALAERGTERATAT